MSRVADRHIIGEENISRLLADMDDMIQVLGDNNCQQECADLHQLWMRIEAKKAMGEVMWREL